MNPFNGTVWPRADAPSHTTMKKGHRKMKFTDGAWRLQPGVELLRARGIVDVEADDDGLTIHAATWPISSREAEIGASLLKIRLSSPAPDVIGVSVSHHAGEIDRGPSFELHRTDARPSVVHPTGEGTARVTAGRLSAVVPTTGELTIDFVNDGGRVVARSPERGVAVAKTPEGTFALGQLGIGVAENLYGLGERFGPFVRNGQSVDIWNEDGGTSTDLAYKNIPFLLSSAGYGIFVDDPGRVSFEIGTEFVARTQFSVPGERLQFYVIYGATPKEILSTYTALTGRPAEIPAWSYGLWLSTSFTTDYDEKTVSHFVDGMAERDIPLSVFHFDCYWMRGLHWSDFQWDPAMFPDPKGMLQRLKQRGLRICLWINPYIAQRSRLFEIGARKGYLVTRPDGSVWQWDYWQPGMALVDFTNPEAVAWFQAELRSLLDDGVDCFKTDFGERIPTDVVWHDGSDPARMHNYYTLLYNRAVHDLLREERGEGEAVLFSRSTTAGSQQYPVHWGGDCESTYPAMSESLRGGLSLGLGGFGYWSHDIGGFEGTPDPALFKRWVAFGLLSSHSRLHGRESYRVPWAYDEESVDVTRHFVRLKMSLMPYLLGQANHAVSDGIPLMRAMFLEFPTDRAVADIATQYMLGESLLVAPVFSDTGQVDVYLPEAGGAWTALQTGERVPGGSWRRETHDVFSLPLYVRPGTVLPIGARTDGPEYDWADGVTLRLFELPDGFDSSVSVRSGNGGTAHFRVRRHDATVTVETDDATGSWSARIDDRTVAASGPGRVSLDDGPVSGDRR